ncbi:MAG: sortase [Clostridiaceae bacterium]|nr:sortase [Clostridiaceae bacterium]
MNQILDSNFNIDKNYSFSKLKKFKIIFWVFIIITIFFIIFYFYLKYNTSQKEKISKSLVDNFSITTLYPNINSSDYISQKIAYSENDKIEPFVVGLIKIDKIDLMYPILSHSTEDLLSIAPCRFYGPLPNNVGNLCIAGHNYANNTLFGKLHLITIGDVVEIYDLDGTKLLYTIYEKKEINSDDLSCLNQSTDGLCEITLITCNTIKGNRTIIKAKENR